MSCNVLEFVHRLVLVAVVEANPVFQLIGKAKERHLHTVFNIILLAAEDDFPSCIDRSMLTAKYHVWVRDSAQTSGRAACLLHINGQVKNPIDSP